MSWILNNPNILKRFVQTDLGWKLEAMYQGKWIGVLKAGSQKYYTDAEKEALEEHFKKLGECSQ